MPLVTFSSAAASSTSQTPASNPLGARSESCTCEASGTAPAGAGAWASAGRPTCSAPPSASAASSSASALFEIVGTGQRRAALERGRDSELVAGLGLDQRERQGGATAHELGQRGCDAVGALDGRRQRIGASARGRCSRRCLGGAPLRVSCPGSQRVDLGARLTLGRQCGLVRAASPRRCGLGLGQHRLCGHQFRLRALGRAGQIDAALGALRRPGTLGGECGLGVRRRARQLRCLPARCQRRLAAFPRPRYRRRQLGLVDRCKRGLGGAQALGRLDRGVRLQRQRGGLGGEPAGQLALARRLRGDVVQPLCQRLAARGQALGRGRQCDAVRCRALLLAQDRRQLRLRLCAAGGDLGQPRRRGVALLACGDQLVLALAARASRLGQCGGEQAQARLGDLPAQRLGPLGGGRLELQRSQAGAQFALDIARALEIGRDAGELGLGALSPPLELAQPGGLLDEAAALVRPRQQHLVDGALGDDAVQVAAEARLGQEVAHVEAPHGLAVEQVVAVARAIEASHDRQLVARDADAAVAVVDHELDLAHAARGVLLGAGEEHVLPCLGAQLAGRLRGHGPLQRVGDVGLAGAVRADHDRDAGLEAQLQRIAERLEAAHADCTQMHSRPSASTRSSASWAAACSEAFFEVPSPVPMTSSPSTAAVVKLRRCAGPVDSISR